MRGSVWVNSSRMSPRQSEISGFIVSLGMFIPAWTIGTEEIIILLILVCIPIFFVIVFSRLLRRK